MMHIQSHLLSLILISALAPAAAATTGSLSRFQQDRFAIGFWVDPPADERMEERYREIADANFTLVVGGFGAKRARQIRQQIDLCEKLDLKLLAGVPDRDMAKLPPGDSPAMWGYLMKDEPVAREFPQLTKEVAKLRELRPGKLAFINLYPNYVDVAHLQTRDYRDYVRRFVDEVNPDVLCMDHYPKFLPDRRNDGRASYIECVEVMREESQRAGIPFWNFFNTMPYGPHTDPTEGQLRWQIYATIAHGARGVLWFCYYTPLSGEFPKGGAIIDRQDQPTRHYDHAQRINAELKNLGPVLMKLTSTRVTHVVAPGRRDAPEDTTTALASGPITRLAGSPAPSCLVGEFKHEDGRRAVLLHNYDFAHTSWPTLEFDTPAEQIREVSKKTGEEIPLRDDSPDMDGIQISLDAGDARLFLLP